MNRRIIISAVICILNSTYLFAQTGPGGVGASTNNVLWLKAEDLSSSPVSTWSDQSGNGNDVTQGTGANQPTWVEDIINGKPVVRFDGSNDVLNGPASNTLLGGVAEDVTTVTVFRTSSSSRGYLSALKRDAGTSSLYSIDINSNGGSAAAGYAGFLTRNEANSTHNWITFNGGYNDGSGHILIGWVDNANKELFIDGTSRGTDANGMQNISTNSGLFTIGGSSAGGTAYTGDVAEYILYKIALNTARRIIVENYLSSKYGIAIANDYYTNDATHPYEVAGIGQVDASNLHLDAQSAGILEFTSPDDIDDGEFLLFGHDNGDISTWTTTGAPNPGTNIQRLARAWMLNETGDVGAVDITIDNTLLPALPAEYTEYYLLVDDDGDFSSGATEYLLSPAGGSYYTASGVEVGDNSYITIAIVRPVIEFTLTEDDDFETAGVVNIAVNLNYEISTDASATFTVNGGSSATEGGGDDFTIAASPITISAGTTTANIALTLNDDITLETDETVILDLSAPANAELGTNTQFTYIIHDDDDPRKVNFTAGSSNGDESVNPVTLTIQSATPSASDITIDYTVTGGTASGTGVDYTLAAGTATIPGDNSSTTTTLDIAINEDLLDEDDETIIITLSNPGNCNLAATNTTYTYTINDNDDPPVVQFSFATTSASEAVSPGAIEVSLSAISGQDVIVAYTVADGTATGSGTDYTLADGSLTIPAGSSYGNITPIIIDDGTIEAAETFTVTLAAGPTGATLGAQTTNTYSIGDNDDIGFIGPGGVGNASNNVLWLEADELSASPVSAWSDQSGNNNDMSQGTAGYQPTWVDGVINGKPVIRFDGSDDVLDGTASNTMLGGAIEDISVITVFRTASNSRGYLSQIKRDGSTSSLFSIDINSDDGSTLAGSAGFLTRDDANANHFWLDHSNSYNDGNGHILMGWVDDANRELFIDGTSRGTDANGMQSISSNSGAFTIGGTSSGGTPYTGDVAEYIIYTMAINSAQRIIVENYLSSKYGITVPNDYFSHDASYHYDVAGIGREDASNEHTAAQSAKILKLSSPSGMGDGEYLLFGHNNGSIAAWTTTEAPNSGTNIQRLAREWVLDETGDVGTITVTVDTTLLPARPANYSQYFILVDADGDFSSGATQYQMTNTGGANFEAYGVNVSDNYYIAIAVKRPTIQFTLSSSQEFEPNGPATVKVELNMALASTVTVDYTIDASSTATGGGTDYTLSNGTVTITAGNTWANINIPLTDDIVVESSETIVLDLSNPSSGLNLGTKTRHTFSINDDDNARKINFTAGSSSGDESVNTVTLTIQATSASSSDITVDYAVTGGTATGTGTDYTLASGTATIPGDNVSTTTTFDIAINEDIMDEDDETIIITLSNPINGNLASTNTVYTYTITDNDSPPVVQFTSTTTSGSEDTSPGVIEVSLSAPSGQDVVVSYTVADGTATGGYTDYYLADGSLTIPAGSFLANIGPVIVDDATEEGGETFTVTLSAGPTGATLGANTVNTYTISDNDNAIGFIGPGGVGDEQDNVLWLRADDLSASPVSSWADQSGNGNDMSQGTGGYQPTWVNSVMNGKPVIRFDGSDDVLNGPASNALLGGAIQDITLFTAYRTTSSQRGYLSQLKRDGGTSSLLSVDINSDDGSTSVGSAGFLSRDDANANHYWLDYNGSYNDGNGHILSGWIDDANRELFMDGTSRDSDANGLQSVSNNTGVFTIGGTSSGGTPYAGDVAEYIIYTKALNSAQRIIVENYLSSKYNIAIANDKYSLEALHKNEVAGIGRVDASNKHTAAQSAGILKFSSPSSLGDGDYLLFGHDNASVGSWVTTEAPDAGTNIQRLAREWKLDETGDVGTVTITVDTTLLPARPSGYSVYVILVDADGNFSSGATKYKMSYTSGSNFTVTGVDIADNDYVSIGVVRPVIEFTSSISNTFEPNGPALIPVSLNYSLQSSVTVDYTVTGGTATGSGTDYTLANGTLTITAGNTSANISITLVDDIVVESDETITLSLSNPSSGLVIGSNSAHTFTINDDDNARKINFTASSSSGDESVTPVTLTVQATSASSSDITVDYLVTGGTATGSGTDFTLSSGTVTIPGDNSSTTGTFDIVINDDGVDESDETIIIQLISPTNGNLAATNTSYTYTIQDNDSEPTVAFTSTTTSGSESSGTISIEVSLSAASGQDVTVDYTASDVSATGGGTDYLLLDGTLTIPAGDQTANITGNVIDDAIVEGAETFTVTISNPSDATLGGNTTNTFTIADNDNDGYIGPGGVGDANNNLLWLRGNDLSASPVSTWSDQSGNGNDLTQGTGANQPTWVNTVLNGFPVVRFDGSNDVLNGPATNALIGASQQDLTLIALFRTSSTARGYLSTLKRDAATSTLFGLDINSNAGAASAGYAGFLTRNDANSAHTWSTHNGSYNNGAGHILIGRIDDASRELYIDGTSRGSDADGLQSVTTNTGVFTIGGAAAGSTPYNGDVAEYIIYNTPLNTAQRIIVENYLAAKYGLTTGTDIYTEGAYFYEAAGIGREDGSNQHIAAQSAGMFLVNNASSLGDGDYLMFGHNNADDISWTATESPNAAVERIAREWKFDETGNVGTVTVTIDISAFDALPGGFNSYALIIDTDGDGDFTSGSPTFYPLSLVSGSDYEATGVDVGAGYYATIGVVQNISQTTGDFNNAGTWLAGIVPGSGQSAIVDNGDVVTLTANTTLGDLTINGTGTLNLGSYTLSIDNGTISNSGTFNAGTGTVKYSATGDQCVAPLTYYNLTLSGSGTKTLCGNIDVDNDLQLTDSGITLDASGSDYTINIGGKWNNSGTFTAQAGEVIFDGTGTQNLTASSAQTFYNLTINKPSGYVKLLRNISINGTLDMSSGNLDLGAFDATISSTGTITNGSSTSYVQADGVGEINKLYGAVPAAAITFPLGDVNDYSPFTFTLNDATLAGGAFVSVNLRDAKHPQMNGTNDYISRYWTVTPSGISCNGGCDGGAGDISYDMSYIYTDADVNGTEGNIKPMKYSSGAWTDGGSVATGTNTLTWNGVTSFSDVSGGFAGEVLPVELIEFDARLNEMVVDLKWITATEINNDFFTIERSRDGIHFERLDTVKASGNSSTLRVYQLTDPKPYQGISYYRLRQTDYDGHSKQFDPVAIYVTNPSDLVDDSQLNIFPNPVKGSEELYVSAEGLKDLVETKLVIFDIFGKQMYSRKLTNDSSGRIISILSLEGRIPPGIYIVTVASENRVLHRKIIVE
ncbi:MAG: T9SS type A sorting domain-containing protein [Flavobacteriales bacterium]|nr:T9SS type A sorting domain-containing protein [Flavobacteriales bacterium]